MPDDEDDDIPLPVSRQFARESGAIFRMLGESYDEDDFISNEEVLREAVRFLPETSGGSVPTLTEHWERLTVPVRGCDEPNCPLCAQPERYHASIGVRSFTESIMDMRERNMFLDEASPGSDRTVISVRFLDSVTPEFLSQQQRYPSLQSIARTRDHGRTEQERLARFERNRNPSRAAEDRLFGTRNSQRAGQQNTASLDLETREVIAETRIPYVRMSQQVSIDYSAIEDRVLALMSSDIWRQRLLEAATQQLRDANQANQITATQLARSAAQAEIGGLIDETSFFDLDALYGPDVDLDINGDETDPDEMEQEPYEPPRNLPRKLDGGDDPAKRKAGRRVITIRAYSSVKVTEK